MAQGTTKTHVKITLSAKRRSKQTLRRLLTEQQLENLSPAARALVMDIAMQARAKLKNQKLTTEGRERLTQLLGLV
jgi:hypothetical protein